MAITLNYKNAIEITLVGLIARILIAAISNERPVTII